MGYLGRLLSRKMGLLAARGDSGSSRRHRVGRRQAILSVGEAGRVRDRVARFLARVSVEEPRAAPVSICRAARGTGLFEGSRIAPLGVAGGDVLYCCTFARCPRAF